MKKPLYSFLLLMAVVTAFLAGVRHGRRGAVTSASPQVRRIAYYVDPMHPAYKSDKPGIAPDCGMQLEPVYADGGMAATDPGDPAAMLTPSAVRIDTAKQQLFGVRVSAVEESSGTYQLRLFGRVAPDEASIYKINAGIDGYIQEASAVTTGSLVRKNQVLATFSSPSATMTIQTYLLNLGAEDRFKKSATEGSVEGQSLPAANANIQQRTQQLQNLGMSVLQMEEIRRTRQFPESIKIVAPADGVVLARNVSPGQKFERDTEWYRIANLRRVWVLANVFENDAQYLRPGMHVRVSLPNQAKTLAGRISDALPQFDPATRIMKVRLEVDNPGYVLRPDMFVDVELPLAFSRAMVVPRSAVLDSGLKKTVFVERSAGLFAPRQVETGRLFDDRVEIVKGLEAGERIVVSGNFLIGSETRLKDAGGMDGAVTGDQQPVRNGNTAASGKAQGAPRGDADPEGYLKRDKEGAAKPRPSPAATGAPTPPISEGIVVDRIIDFSVKNKFLIFAVVAAACLGGWWSMKHVALDAIPDLSDTQVIVYSRWDRSPDQVEDQVTYPIVSVMLGSPRVKAVRGFSDFGYSYVYVVFDEGTDIYWARSRTLEYLSGVLPSLPQGVKTELGPDATGVGWIFQYVLVDTSGEHSLADLRAYQDWTLRFYLKSVPGVAEVAPLGGFQRQYQVNLDPNRLQAYGIPVSRVVEAVRGGNSEVGGRLLEFGGTEYMVRGRGYAKSTRDFENIFLAENNDGSPITIKDVGQVVLGPDLRRGVSDLDGNGEAVSGIVIMRQGENALQVIDRVKAKLKQVEPGLPRGVKIVPIYDRSELIRSSISNLKSTLIQVLVIVALVVLLFLWHVPSAIIPLITIPVAVLLSFIPFQALGITANIMSLGGIAIAIGALVDASIVVVEQTHKSLEEWQRGDRQVDSRSVIVAAVKQVAGPAFFALLVIAVSFLPVLTLEAQEGRLFKPLAYTKSLAIMIAAVLAITLDPALRVMFTRRRPFAFRPRWLCRTANAVAVGTIQAEERHPISRFLIRLYEPVARWALRRPWAVIAGAVALVIVSVPVFTQLGSEFMPPLDEGSILYMPSTAPGISATEAQRLLQVTDRIIKRFPEVDRVLGKAGRAETATDPAPLSMLETVITLRPRSQWRRVDTWYSSWAPEPARRIFRHITPDHISPQELVRQMNAALAVAGVANAWTMPVKGRIDMLTTGMRTPLGLKVSGADLQVIEKIGGQLQELLSSVKGARSVFAERTGGGFFLDIDWKREELARYGLSLEDAQTVVQSAIGGDNITTAVQGRERYAVNVRFMQDFRGDVQALGRVLVPAAGGKKQIPLAQLAFIRPVSGPAMVRDENGMLTGYVYVDLADRDPKSYVAEAGPLLEKIALPPGYAISWSGQYEGMERVRDRLAFVVPLTLALILALLYANTRSITKTLIVMLAVPFSAVGAIWFLYLLGYNMSIAVWVGLVALLGVDAETGVFMLLYLDLAYEQARREGRMRNLADLQQAIMHGAVRRLRPKFMTVAAAFIGLVPIMWSTGIGSDVMKRIAAPIIGGLFTSFLLQLLVYPAVYQIWKLSRSAGVRPRP